MEMYDDLVLKHGASAINRHPHGVRLSDTIVTDEQVDWCLANLEIGAWTWEDQSIMGVDFAVFTFAREEDSVLFRFIWA